MYLRGTNDYPLTEKTSGNVNRFYVYGPTGLISLIDNGSTYFVLKDHLGSTRVVLNSSSTPVTWYDYTPYGNMWRSTISEDAHYRFTGQEYDPETNLFNFRARMYDGTLGIFYAGDPAGQGFSPYMYCGGNPVIRVDRDGRFWWLVVAAVIGGSLDVGTHWHDITSTSGGFWNQLEKGAEFFGVGAASGALATLGPLGWAGAGALSGVGNTALQGGNIGQMALNGLIGGVSGLAGGYAASWASANLGGAIVNGFNLNANSAISGLITGGIGGAGGAFGGGFTAGLITTGDLGSALQMGVDALPSGLAIGGTVGFSSNISQNINNGRDWFSGIPDKSFTIGRVQNYVDEMAEKIGSLTIKDMQGYSPNLFYNQGLPTMEGIQFNSQVLNEQMQNGAYIYDVGIPSNWNGPYIPSPYYEGIEQSMINNLNYDRVFHARQYGWLIIYR